MAEIEIPTVVMPYTGSPFTFEQLAKHAKEAVGRVGDAFTEPDDDWVPVLMCQAPDGALHIAELSRLMSSEGTKDFLADVGLPRLIDRVDSTQVAFVTSAWAAKVPADTPMEDVYQMRASQRPDRTEVVQILVAAPGKWEIWSADILRTTNRPPTLSRWERLLASSEKGSSVEGRMFEPVIITLELVNERREREGENNGI